MGKFWTIFTNFGTASAGLIGIIIIFRGIKLIADTLIHGYTLHRIFGWSIYLLGAFWDSVTNLLLHLGKRPPPDGPNKADSEAPIASAPHAHTEAQDTPLNTTRYLDSNTG